MKTLFTLALALCLGVSSFANTEKENLMALSSVYANDKMVNISLKEGIGKVKLTVLNESGRKLHQRFLKIKVNTKVPLDLSNLPSGEYYIVIESKDGGLDDRAVYTVETHEAPAPLPLVAMGTSIDKDSFKLTVVGLEEPGVEVRVYNENGRSIFSEKINETEGFSRVYHLKNRSIKDIQVQVTDATGRTKFLNF